jgi:hypothetical protein
VNLVLFHMAHDSFSITGWGCLFVLFVSSSVGGAIVVRK